MLDGINPLLTGTLLLHLDSMGHSDVVVISDAHFPAHSVCERVVDLPGASAPEVLAAIRSVVPLDDAPSLDLMDSGGEVLAVQEELMAAAGTTLDATRLLGRQDFYAVAQSAYLVVRTGEMRAFGNAALRKGLVGV